MRPGSTRALAVAVVLLVGSLAPASTLAGGESFSAEFSTDGGNEWWIEVAVDGNEPVTGVDARIDGGEWKPLEHKDWGDWAESYHAPKGSIVEFRASNGDGETVVSQAYRWTSGEPADDTGSEGFEASFATDGGNEWWIEVAVDGNEPLAGVDTRLDGGEWKPLEHKDWGDWAASYHAPEGTVVEFRATSTDGEQVTSTTYRWTGGEQIDDADDGTSEGFAPTFGTDGGNEWWIQVGVEADEPIASVDTRVDGGEWKPLEHKDWGDWAESYHAPEGTLVEFRATSTDGETVTSTTYRWTEGEEVDQDTGEDPGGATMDAAFGPKAGNEWWVETYVVANSSITHVEARADGGAWHDLELRDWGAWAGSFHAPDGSEVTFRAENETGAVDTSQAFVWPEATPADEPDADWPTVGSYVDYELYGGGPTSEYKYEKEAVYVHDGEGWVVRCQGYTEDPGGRQQTFDYAKLAPPEGPSDVATGDTVSVEKGACHRATYDNLTVQEQRAYDTRQNGEETTVSTWYANRTDDCRCLAWETYWERDTDIVTEWWRGGRTGQVGELQDTDAPVSER